jgi:hypothetical protein
VIDRFVQLRGTTSFLKVMIAGYETAWCEYVFGEEQWLYFFPPLLSFAIDQYKPTE